MDARDSILHSPISTCCQCQLEYKLELVHTWLNSERAECPYCEHSAWCWWCAGAREEAFFERLLKQGYPGDSHIALERCAVLRRAIFNETNQLSTCAREIKKPTDIQRLAHDILVDALPSSGKKPATLALQCAWAECNDCCSRADRVETHVFTHIGFKPFPATETVAMPTGEFIIVDRGDSRSFI